MDENGRNSAHLLQDFLSEDLLQSRDLHHLPFDLPDAHKKEPMKYPMKTVRLASLSPSRWHQYYRGRSAVR